MKEYLFNYWDQDHWQRSKVIEAHDFPKALEKFKARYPRAKIRDAWERVPRATIDAQMKPKD